MDSMKNELFHAWVAGFFDGEGCIQVTKSKNLQCRFGFSSQLYVTLTQQDPRPLTAVKERFGGTIALDKNPHSDDRKTRYQVWRWRLIGQQALEFLKLIRPYCLVKGEQIDAVSEFPFKDARGLTYSGGNHMPQEAMDTRLAIRAALQQLRQDVKTPLIREAV
jgi:hypothetical protein